ncbi:MAG: hypothetical protein HXY46_09775 [Syntrophaceae bacterium]|nr:hypothetical protein [Syntrophaceae bacterium]
MEDIQSLIDQIRTDILQGRSEDEILEALFPLFEKDRETGERLVELMTRISHPKIAKVLHRMLQVSPEKRVRKLIKRSLYRLKAKGIAVEEVSPEKRISVLRPLQTESPKGFGGGIDFLGQRLLLLAIPHAGRGLTVMQGVISDTEGLVDFSGGEMTRKELRAFLKEVQEESPFPLVEMEPSYAGFLFHKAYQLTLERKKALPHGYLRFKSEIEGIKKDYERPLIYALLPSDELTEDDRMLQRGGELLLSREISSWRVEEEIRPYAEEVWEAEESKIVLTQSQKEARFQGIYQKALSGIFTDERRLLYQRRLEEMAYIFFKLGKQEEARISLAVAIDLQKPLNPIQPNPFLLQLVVKSIFAFLKDAYERKAAEPSLIVRP